MNSSRRYAENEYISEKNEFTRGIMEKITVMVEEPGKDARLV